MRAALYARKSSDSEAGVQRQVELARDFAAARGWTVDPAHVYVDNDVSGAVFDRPGLNALLAAMGTKPRPFDALVMMDTSRLGRDMAETLPLQLKITTAGVRIWHYQDGQELLLETPTQKLVASVANFAAEDYRYQVRLKTRDALRKKAEQGHAVAGRVYGYANQPVTDATGKRSHVVLAVNEREAAVVRRIFAWTAEGLGVREIARRLNREALPAPRGARWAATTVTTLLNRGLYRGRRTWSTVSLEVPELRIVDEELWERAQRRRAASRAKHAGHRRPNGQLHGRPETPTPHLLSGLLQCGTCGSGMIATSRVAKSGKVRRYYCCARAYKLGASGCRHLLNYDRITEAVVSHFADLTPRLLDQMVDEEYERWLGEVRAVAGERGALVDTRDRLDAELGRLAEAIAAGGQLPALLAALRTKQAQRDEVAAKLEHAQGSEAAFRAALVDWHTHMVQITTASLGGLAAALQAGEGGRQLLKQIIEQPIVVSPRYETDGTFLGWAYAGEAHLGKLTGLVPAGARVTHAQIPWAARG